MLRRLTKSKKGFSLLETIFYIALVSVLLGSMGLMINLTNKAKAREATRREVEDSGRQALEIILQTVRNASAINAPVSGATGAALSVDVDDSVASPTVFVLVGDAITVQEGAAAVENITNSKVVASSFSVENLSRSSTPGIVRVSFILSGQVTSGTSPFVYEQTFYGTASLQ